MNPFLDDHQGNGWISSFAMNFANEIYLGNSIYCFTQSRVFLKIDIREREREREISRRISQNQTFFSERGHQVDETSAKADGDHIVVHWKIEDWKKEERKRTWWQMARAHLLSYFLMQFWIFFKFVYSVRLLFYLMFNYWMLGDFIDVYRAIFHFMIVFHLHFSCF